MRVLMICQAVPYLPCFDGFRLIPAYLLKELGARHEIHLIALSQGNETEQQLEWAKPFCASLTFVREAVAPRNPISRILRVIDGIAPQLANCVSEASTRLKPDLVHFEGPNLAQLAQSIRLPVPSILSAHDCVSLRYSQFAKFARTPREWMVSRLNALNAARVEQSCFREIDRVVVTSSVDAEALAKRILPQRISVIPNGIDSDHWKYEERSRNNRIVFTGNMNWPPNEDASEFFAKKCFPKIKLRLPDAEFWIVGATPSKRVRQLAEQQGVVVTGTVPDIREYVHSAAAYVSALRFGAGVKNKILEAMALGIPIVATRQSLTGTPVTDGEELLIADTPDEISESVLRILLDDLLASSLASKARRLVENQYSWKSIAMRFEDHWKSTSSASQDSDMATPTLLSSS